MRLAMVVVVVAALLARAQERAPHGPGGNPQAARGEYIVNHVAMCVQCHSPRNSVGEIDRMRLLQGAPIPFESPWPSRKWAVRAPHIAGLPGFRDADVVRLLTTGSRPDGRIPNPPMPPFRLTREDADAVVAYLRTLR
jgi:mono/diheme cytochrome c family protein